MLGKGLVAALALAALTGAAMAQEPARRAPPTVGAVLEACGADLKERCGSEPLALARVSACLRRNEAALAPGCKTFVSELRTTSASRREALRPARDAVTKACEADVTNACGADLTPRARGACFRRHIDKMSEGCRAAMADLRRLQQASRQPRTGAN